MKILKIEDNKGYYSLDPNSEWKPIDQISKDDLMTMLSLYLEEDLEIDPYEEDLIQNQAQQIIYKSLFDKFSTLNDNKSKFRDESERMYLNELRKYNVTGESVTEPQSEASPESVAENEPRIRTA